MNVGGYNCVSGERRMDYCTHMSSTVFSAPSPTFMNTSSMVVQETPKLVMPY